MRKSYCFFLVLLFACKSKPAPQFPVLEEKKISVARPESTEKNNLIEQMWVEVRKNTAETRDIELEAKEWDKILQDSLTAWNHFSQKNNEYYDLIPLYLSKIQDSVVKKYWTRYYDSSAQSFQERVDSLKQLVQTAYRNKKELNDLMIQLKLKTTHKILRDYQEVQMPDKTPIEKLVSYQDSILLHYRIFLHQDTIQ